MLGCALDPGLHMLGRALHSGLHNKVACVLVQHAVVCCFSTNSFFMLRRKLEFTDNFGSYFISRGLTSHSES